MSRCLKIVSSIEGNEILKTNCVFLINKQYHTEINDKNEKYMDSKGYNS